MSWKLLKYVIQSIVFLSDILLFVAVISLFISVKLSPIGFIFSVALSYFAWQAWQCSGGFSHWKKETRQNFYKNWDKMAG